MSDYRCTCTAPDGSVLERKRATKPYTHAVIAKQVDSGKWKICSMHKRLDLAKAQLVGPEKTNPEIKIVSVRAMLVE